METASRRASSPLASMHLQTPMISQLPPQDYAGHPPSYRDFCCVTLLHDCHHIHHRSEHPLIHTQRLPSHTVTHTQRRRGTDTHTDTHCNGTGTNSERVSSPPNDHHRRQQPLALPSSPPHTYHPPPTPPPREALSLISIPATLAIRTSMPPLR